MSEENLFDLDTNLDEISDLAQFINPHDGTHVFGIIYAGPDKVGKETSGLKIVYQLIETIEAANDDESAAPVGSIFAESFTGNEKGLEVLKLRLKQLFGEDITGTLRPYIDALNSKFQTEGMVKMITKLVRTTGKDAEGNKREYENVRILSAEAIEPVTLPDGFKWQDYTPRELD